MEPFRILFLCWGNICRSPTAEAVMRHRVEQAGLTGLVEVDSAGVSAEHEGSPPDRRAAAEAARRGLDIGGLRARSVCRDDWDRYDLLLVADATVERSLLRQAPPGGAIEGKVARITAFGDSDGVGAPLPADVPDPYYGGTDGFTDVFDLLDRACAGILANLQQAGALPRA